MTKKFYVPDGSTNYSSGVDYVKNLSLPNNLRILDVSFNLLEDISEFDSVSVSTIEYLDLSGNLLRKFQISQNGSSCPLQNVRQMNISSNNLESAIINNKCFQKLEVLDAGFNPNLKLIEIEFLEDLRQILLENITSIDSSGKLDNYELKICVAIFVHS